MYSRIRALPREFFWWRSIIGESRFQSAGSGAKAAMVSSAGSDWKPYSLMNRGYVSRTP